MSRVTPEPPGQMDISLCNQYVIMRSARFDGVTIRELNRAMFRMLGRMLVDDREYERLTLSLKATGGGIWDHDIESDTLFCSNRWYEILGIDGKSSPVSSIEDFKPYIHPDDVEMATKADIAQLSDLMARNARYFVEFRIIRPTGEVRWLRSVACLVEDGATHHLRAVGCITDITEFHAEQPLPSLIADAPGDSRGEATTEASEPDGTGVGEAGGNSFDLSEREIECLQWVSMGKTAWETAAILGRSQRTVEFHLKNAVGKLGASNTLHAAAISIRKGLL